MARLALESRSPVVPTAMIGGFEFQPPGKITPRLRIRPGVRFGKPLDFSRYYGMEHDHVVLRAMTDEIMYELMKLSGQEYVDQYAQRLKMSVPLPRRNRGRRAGEAGFTGILSLTLALLRIPFSVAKQPGVTRAPGPVAAPPGQQAASAAHAPNARASR